MNGHVGAPPLRGMASALRTTLMGDAARGLQLYGEALVCSAHELADVELHIQMLEQAGHVDVASQVRQTEPLERPGLRISLPFDVIDTRARLPRHAPETA